MMRVRVLYATLMLLLAGVQPGHAACNTASIAADAPDSRYTISGETVTDTRTGLVWKRCVEGLSGPACTIGGQLDFNWQAALQRAVVINTGGFAGFSDWRLPNRNELATLVERRCASPAVNAAIFPSTPVQASWTSTTQARHVDGTQAWQVDFNSGELVYGSKALLLPVRLVRGGP